MTETGKRYLSCPCGEWLTGADEDDLVDRARQHLIESHPDHSYTREQILFLAH
ncbi:DUF1059 domain-containing protein [Nocardia sp. NPDC050718]|uniref:DUF1059 domain-containing protein n=1 Tax=Nocardia sp. NPDC050718 TaxID=3155788 RepID=UPI0033FD7FE4